jgi:hypothetical protein
MGENSTQGLVQIVQPRTCESTQVFFFNKKDKKYYITEPDDSYSNIIEPWAFEDSEVFDYNGYSRTGMSTAFQIGLSAKERI